MKGKRIAKYKHVVEPKYVWYSDAPITSENITERKISIKELEEKIGGGFCYSENVYCDPGFSQKFESTQRTTAVIKKILERIKEPLIDKLVICYMGPEVGYGVFARSKINMGDVVAIYNGELSKQEKDSEGSGYGFDVGDKIISNFHIDSESTGGMARFFQHLPYNPDLSSQKLIRIFRKNPKLIQVCLEISGDWNNLNRREQQQSLKILTDDVVNGDGNCITEMLYDGLTEMELFEHRNIEFKKNIAVSYSNLLMSKHVIDPKNPILYFYAEHDIDRGMMVGFPYGIGYWSNIGRLPLLFDTKGVVIPREHYKYKKMLISVCLPGRKLKGFPYTREQYLKEQGENEATLIGNIPCPVSFFSTRKLLAKNNIITKNHLPTRQSDLFVD